MNTSNFIAVFDQIKTEIDFLPGYMGDNRYLDPLCSANLHDELRGFVFTPGSRCKMVDSMDRRAIIISTDFGNVVFFERHAPRIKAVNLRDRVEGRRDPVGLKEQDLVVVCSLPEELAGVIPKGPVSDDLFVLYAGWDDADNIGHTVRKIAEGVYTKLNATA